MAKDEGRLGRGYWFDCPLCHRQYTVLFLSPSVNIGEAKTHLRNEGCMDTVLQGWVCPSCVARDRKLSRRRLAALHTRRSGLIRRIEDIEVEIEQKENPTQGWVEWKQNDIGRLSREATEVDTLIEKFALEQAAIFDRRGA